MSDSQTFADTRKPLDAQTRRWLAMNGPLRLTDDSYGSGSSDAGGCSSCASSSCSPDCLPSMLQDLPQRPWTVDAFRSEA
jgi:hypothetical protein